MPTPPTPPTQATPSTPTTPDHLRGPRILPLAILLSAWLSLPACSSGPRPAGHQVTRSQVEQLLAEQQAAWNRGDLAAFVAGYWDDERLTFIGSRGITRGREDLLANYRKGYPDAESRGRLTFQVLDFRPIGTGAALVQGQYHLQRKQPASGYWTLLVERTPEGLRVTHDHTSTSPADG